MDVDPIKKPHVSNHSNNTPIRITISAAPSTNKMLNNSMLNSNPCHICSKLDTENTLIHCFSCGRYSHQNCLQLNPKLVDWDCISKYDWQCMECKRCSKCSNSHDEDKMLFCDRCDRGFHTYCVGIDVVPNGAWICNTCKSGNENNVKTPNSNRIARSPSKKVQAIKMKQNALATDSPNSLYDSNSSRRGRGRPPGSHNRLKGGESPLKR